MRYLEVISAIVALNICTLAFAEGAGKVPSVTMQRLRGLDAEPGTWLTGGRDYRQSYFSPLQDINKSNIKKLGYAWSYDIPHTGTFEATPIVVDGVMFTSGNKGTVYALDATTGKELWTFVPQISEETLRRICCRTVNRGVALWHGKVYVASVDGYLYALNADTGAVVWKVNTIVDASRTYSITGAPYLAKNNIVIGNAGAELDARGYITAYDTETGRLQWRFFTVPGDPKNGFEHRELKRAAKTWDPNSLWELGLGGTAWDGMAYDPELDLLYVGTGNGTPWARALRSPSGGDNLFLASILALKPDTGRLVWYYQTVPGENWDYTATQKLILADLRIAGKYRRTILQAPKNGFFYVLDRQTGELLSAEPIATVTWASHVDLKSGRPIETGQGDYSKEPKLIFPSSTGAHNWPPMAYNPHTGLVYVSIIDNAMVFMMPENGFTYRKGQRNFGAQVFDVRQDGNVHPSKPSTQLPPIEELAAGQPDRHPRAFLKAWDPLQQRARWVVETEDLNGGLGSGVMTTVGGLVFQGRGNGNLVVLDAESGVLLHSIDVRNKMVAAPMTYKVGDIQYVAIMTNGASPSTHGRIVAFKLGGGTVPEPIGYEPKTAESRLSSPPVADDGTPQQIARGMALFQLHCAGCHGSGHAAPDLSSMNEQAHLQFIDIVLKGVRAEKGMGNFSGVLSEDDVRAIHAYVTRQAWTNYRIKEHRK